MLRLSLCLLLLSHSACSMLLGWVESPGYPSGYLPDASLNWSRCAHEGHALSLTLTHLDLEDSQDCENDGLKIFSNGNLISILCGQRTFEELQSAVNPLLVSPPGGCLSLSFHSDYSNIKKHTGFRGFYTVQDFDECDADPDNKCTQFCHNFIGGYHCSCRHGYHLDPDKHTCTVSCTEDLSGSQKGVISTPSWPGAYAENADCSYTLSVEEHLQLELNFSKVFDVEQSSDGQCIDSVRVETGSGTLGPFCGYAPPSSPLLTHSNHVQIRFTSDGFGSNNGFSVQYNTRAKVCPGVVTLKSSVAPQHPEYKQGETVTVTCELGHHVDTFEKILSVSEYVTTCQTSGVWSPKYNCEPVDCGTPDIPDDGILQLVDADNLSTQFEDEIQFQCSSKYYTLEGDDTYICNGSGHWVSVGSKEKLPKCTEVCGKTETDVSSAGRILGGRTAELGELPWQLLIREPRRGGASLINDRWAVTAAHVVDGYEQIPIHLYGGLVDAKKVINMLSDVVVMDSEKIIIHPNYAKGILNTERTNYDNDIALIRLASRVELGPNLLPICLPEAEGGLGENEQGTVSGWGRTDTSFKSQMLQYAHIAGISLTECTNTPNLKNTPLVFTENMFCAGARGTDSCRGDSGGPFVLPMLGKGNKNNRGPYRLKGIVSWGSSCDKMDYKGYYTKVDNYVDWIKETINRVEAEE
ncbi:complement C1s subcomponent [Centroberyx affinis]|uniref:complement C1s subcomponent n=1 Tax=Centroberyx affinis TaxID=166261 RepID=UPI003A5B9E3A